MKKFTAKDRKDLERFRAKDRKDLERFRAEAKLKKSNCGGCEKWQKDIADLFIKEYSKDLELFKTTGKWYTY